MPLESSLMIAERPLAFNRRLTAIKACANIGPVPMRADNRDPDIVDDDMAAVFRNKTPLERLRIAFGLWTSTRNMVERLLRSQHPDWDDRTIKAEVGRRMSHGTG
jgi:hypothetical protein